MQQNPPVNLEKGTVEHGLLYWVDGDTQGLFQDLEGTCEGAFSN